MTQTLEAVFHGKAIHPDEPILLEPHTRVQIVIESLREAEVKAVGHVVLRGGCNISTD
jgi:hypothetical protein